VVRGGSKGRGRCCGESRIEALRLRYSLCNQVVIKPVLCCVEVLNFYVGKSGNMNWKRGRRVRHDGRCLEKAKDVTTNTPHRRFGSLKSGEVINWMSGHDRTDIIDKLIWTEGRRL
jgi:hypothetical protein